MATFNQPPAQASAQLEAQMTQQPMHQYRDNPNAYGAMAYAQYQGKDTLPKWATTLGQCNKPAGFGDWCAACVAPCCLAAAAKTKMDNSNCCFNAFCFGNPIAATSWVRRAYNIDGTCGDDCCYGVICLCCAARRTYNEVEVGNERGTTPPLFIGGPQDWQHSLFSCECGDFFRSILCFGCMTNEIRRILQPPHPKLQPDSTCFDCFCVPPCAMYGQVRHMYGIRAEFDGIEDVCLPVACYPCTMSRARREAEWRFQQMKASIAAQQGGQSAAAGMLQKLGFR